MCMHDLYTELLQGYCIKAKMPKLRLESLNTSNSLSEDESVNVVRPFVSVCDVKVRDVSEDVVFVHYSVSSQDIKEDPRVLQSFSTIVTLHHRDHIRCKQF